MHSKPGNRSQQQRVSYRQEHVPQISCALSNYRNQDLSEESSMQEIPYDASHIPIDYDNLVDAKEDEKRARREQRASLEKDVAQLQKKLIVEVNMRNALNRGLSRPLGALPRIYASLPVETRELLLEVAVLEEEIVSLEKQVVHLGRKIDDEVPVTDKETVCPSPHQLPSPRKANILGSPSVSPKDSSRINSKPAISPRKSSDRKTNLSKPLLPAGNIAESKNNPSKVTVSPRKSVDVGGSIKSPIALKDFSKPPKCITIVVPPPKSQLQRNSLLSKAPPRNSRDAKSRRLSFSNKGPNGVFSSALNTVPFVPKNLSLSKDGYGSTPPVSPATGGPIDVAKTSSRPRLIKKDNDKPPVTGHAQVRKKDAMNDRVAPIFRTTRQPGKDKDPVDIARRIPRQPLKHGPVVTRKTMGVSTDSKPLSMDSLRTSFTPDAGSSSPSGSSTSGIEHPNSVHAQAGEQDGNDADIPSTDMLDGDQNSIQVSPDNVKTNRPSCSPEREKNRGLEQVTDSVLLSEEVVELLKTIYGNLQEEQSPLRCDSGSSSQASMSASASSESPDDYKMRGGVNINFRLDGCHLESFPAKRSARIRFMGDCYPSEVADRLDPFSYMSRGNLNNRIDFHEKLMS